MTATVSSRVYGYGYVPVTAFGDLPYSYNYDPDYDFPIPDWDDPRWRLKPASPSLSVYAPEISIDTRYDTLDHLPLQRPRPPPLPPVRPTVLRTAWLVLFGLGLLFLIGFVASSR